MRMFKVSMRCMKIKRSKTLRRQQRPQSANRDVFWMPVNSQIIAWFWIQSRWDKGAFGRDTCKFSEASAELN